MPREHRTDQPLRRPPGLRVIEGELVSARVQPLPAHRRPVPIVGRLRVAARPVAWGRVTLLTARVLATVAAAGGAGWLLVTAVLSLIATVTALITLLAAWVQAHLLLIVLAAGLLLFLLARIGGSSSCAGLHCGGCRR